MSKKRTQIKSEKQKERLTQFPSWYWKNGLHDAMILSVRELDLAPDYKQMNPKRNCLEFLLNSENAIYETSIKRISLYNYRILCTKTNDVKPITLEEFQNTYWLGDSIEQLENNIYLLEIECTDSHSNLMYLSVKFEIPEIERE